MAIRNQCVGLRLPQADVSLIKNLTLNSVTQTRRGVRGGYRSSKSKTSVCYFNAQSVRNKLLHINDHLSDKNFSIIGIVETWLMEKDHAVKQQLTPTGYILKCIDRKGRSGGGVALLCKQEWGPKLDSAETFTSFEYISCVLTNSNTKLRVCVVYRPPNTENITTGQFFQEFSELLSKMVLQKEKLLIMGDFNFHMENIDSYSVKNMIDLLDEFGLKQHVTDATSKHANHMLDLIITRNSESLIYDTPKISTYLSDHASVVFQLNSSNHKHKESPKSYRPLNKIDVTRFKQDLLKLRYCHKTKN